MQVPPKRNVTFPFHRHVRGSVLWVHRNKGAEKSFQAPGCVCLFVCLSLTPHGLLNHMNNRFDQLSYEATGILCSGFHLEKIRLWLGDVMLGSDPVSFAVWQTTPKLSGTTQQLIVLFTNREFGRAWQERLCSSSVNLGVSSGAGEFTSNVAHSQGWQVGAGCCLGVQPEASVLQTWVSLWGFLGLPHSVAAGF